MTPHQGPPWWSKPPLSLAWTTAISSRFLSLVLPSPLRINFGSRNHREPFNHSSSQTSPFNSVKVKFFVRTERPSTAWHPSHFSGSGYSVFLPSFHSMNTPPLPPPLSLGASLLLSARFLSARHPSSSVPHFLLNEIYPLISLFCSIFSMAVITF